MIAGLGWAIAHAGRNGGQFRSLRAADALNLSGEARTS